MSEADKIRRLQVEVEKAIRDIVSSSSLEKIASDLPERIKVRTRLGYGVSKTGGPREKLKPLSSSTQRSKNYKKNRGELSDQTTPRRSNLTDTGQLLDSLEVKSERNGEVQIRPKGNRNTEVARYVTDGGRPFLDLSKPELKSFVEKLGAALLEKLLKVLKD